MSHPWRTRTLVAEVPLDREGWALRVYHKVWPDGSSCIDIQKWVRRADGSWSFYQPAQYLQIPVPVAMKVLGALAKAAPALFEGVKVE